MKVYKVHKVCKVRNKGFTLVEMVVVVAVTGIIMAAITGVLLNSFKTKNRVNVADLVEQNGSMLLSELRKNVVNGAVQNCAADKKSIVIVSKMDSGVTTISCASNKIASSSASSVDLSGSNVVVTCDSFVECEPNTGKVNKVKFTFTLSGGNDVAGPADFASRTFVTEVATRD